MATTVALHQFGFDSEGLSERQHAILDVAGRMFAERGFAGTDVQVVADEVGVGKGTVYRNFATKEELFLAAVDREMFLLTRALLEATKRESDPLQGLLAAIHAYLAFFDERSHAVELLIIERATFSDRKDSTYFRYKETLRDYYEGLNAELIARGTYRALSASRVFELVSDVLYGTIFTNRFAARHEPYGEQAATIIDMLMNGFLAEPDRDLAKQ